MDFIHDIESIITVSSVIIAAASAALATIKPEYYEKHPAAMAAKEALRVISLNVGHART